MCPVLAILFFIVSLACKIVLCPHFPHEELGLREPDVTKLKAMGSEFETHLCLSPIPALSHCPTQPFWQNQHACEVRNLPSMRGKYSHFGDGLRMSQLGEMILLQVFQCQDLWTTSWLGWVGHDPWIWGCCVTHWICIQIMRPRW